MTDDEARALDRQVALALGYTEDVFDWAYGGDSDHIVKASCWSLPDGRHTYQGSLPHFSTDLATAWTVLDGLETRGARWTIERLSDAYCVRILMPPASGPDEYGATMESVQEAICRAALAVLDITKHHATYGA